MRADNLEHKVTTVSTAGKFGATVFRPCLTPYYVCFRYQSMYNLMMFSRLDEKPERGTSVQILDNLWKLQLERTRDAWFHFLLLSS